ncbi:hypothetical protein HUA74_18415 [Myxococcus sp. CA051A]|uniref:Uncharacterized protein n=1 Tax=Myxococcus llanfairpwllgwyngyllgogerychwyrndrobwllllantysiliogogogochensis TaxID=2590453 RepID=A0A540X978_9BACT|nr:MULTISPECIES: hypothetical protein [Myxococcus]NTX62629.1 hypothetical protein [Myxococcus sp. CA051A]TQF17234.1 hypothetical protein FJV41_04110 [Myxococcus llanfairpwllgwyngyllgogerychwyrndrobwllllantysiliogogogochensis]
MGRSPDPITLARHRVAVLREDLELLEAELSRSRGGRRHSVATVPPNEHRAAWLRTMLARAELVLRALRLRAVNARIESIRRPRVVRPAAVQLALFAPDADEAPDAAPEDVVEVPEGARVLYLPRPTCPGEVRLHVVMGGAA